MIAVSIAGELGNTASVKHMLSDAINPIRSAALQRAITFLENACKKESPIDWQERFIATTASGQAYEGQRHDRLPAPSASQTAKTRHSQHHLHQ
ncbi:MAG: hypothetical protein ABF946_08415 [Acetobacter papayae]